MVSNSVTSLTASTHRETLLCPEWLKCLFTNVCVPSPPRKLLDDMKNFFVQSLVKILTELNIQNYLPQPTNCKKLVNLTHLNLLLKQTFAATSKTIPPTGTFNNLLVVKTYNSISHTSTTSPPFLLVLSRPPKRSELKIHSKKMSVQKLKNEWKQ